MSNICGMKRLAGAVFVLVSLGLCSGCSMGVHATKVTPSLVRQIGLPEYPNSSPLAAQDIQQKVGPLNTDALVAEFVTPDPPSKVADFYQKRFPRATRRSVPFGRENVQLEVDPLGNTAGQPAGRRRMVNIMAGKDRTMIQLQLIVVHLPSPSPAASAPPSP